MSPPASLSLGDLSGFDDRPSGVWYTKLGCFPATRCLVTPDEAVVEPLAKVAFRKADFRFSCGSSFVFAMTSKDKTWVTAWEKATVGA